MALDPGGEKAAAPEFVDSRAHGRRHAGALRRFGCVACLIYLFCYECDLIASLGTFEKTWMIVSESHICLRSV